VCEAPGGQVGESRSSSDLVPPVLTAVKFDCCVDSKRCSSAWVLLSRQPMSCYTFLVLAGPQLLFICACLRSHQASLSRAKRRASPLRLLSVQVANQISCSDSKGRMQYVRCSLAELFELTDKFVLLLCVVLPCSLASTPRRRPLWCLSCSVGACQLCWRCLCPWRSCQT
jgi:hypothetical protein